MRTLKIITLDEIVSLLFFFLLNPFFLIAQSKIPDSNLVDACSMVNPFLGTIGGNVFPGVCVPFGMVKLGPDMKPLQSTSGYSSTNPVVGFSHNHTSGTGGGARYANIQVIPQTGNIDQINSNFKSRSNEYASPGYYQISLSSQTGDIDVRLTTSHHVGFHQYQFSDKSKKDSVKANILINVSHTFANCKSAKGSIVNDTIFAGEASFDGGWGAAAPYTIYFYAVFDKPAFKSGTWSQDSLMADNKNVEGNDIGLYASFSLSQKEKVQLKVAISYLNIEKAKENLKELPGWDFESVRNNAYYAWNKYLSAVEVSGGTPEKRAQFYSCLRNSLLMPTDITGENPGWQSNKPHYWDHYCIWDVFRSVMPLHSLLYPSKQVEILNSMLDVYNHNGWLPDAWIAGHYANNQGGSNADVVFADAFAKDLSGFDKKKAFEAMLKNATGESEEPANKGRYLRDYLRLGYLTRQSSNGASSRTMEYAYNDFCIAQVAKSMGNSEVYMKFMKRAQNVFTLFNDSIGYFWAKDSLGRWEPNFSLHSLRPDHWNDPYFYEGGSEVYSYYVPHDMQGLINRHGGSQKFAKRLDEFFNKGRFHLGNEPLFLVPYSYNYAGMQFKTALRVRAILDQQFGPGSNGLPGQDDSGAISSWYVFSSMGIFPVAGQNIYLIGSPLFSQTIINLPNGKKFRILAPGTSAKNIYIRSASLNGKSLHRAWITHQEIVKGGQLTFEMSDKPTNWGNEELPPSLSSKSLFQ